MSDALNAEGGCYCGAVRFEVSGSPVMKAQCHCRPCQYITGGGPNYFLIVPENAYRFTQGAPATFERSDLDNPRLREFCATCGTHLTTRIRERGLVVVKVGTFDDPQTAYGGPDMAIHCQEIPAFHAIPDGLPAFNTLPPRPGE